MGPRFGSPLGFALAGMTFLRLYLCSARMTNKKTLLAPPLPVKLLMDLPQLGVREVRIDLRGGDACVT